MDGRAARVRRTDPGGIAGHRGPDSGVPRPVGTAARAGVVADLPLDLGHGDVERRRCDATVAGRARLGPGERPLVSCAVGIHGLGDRCAPSAALANGTRGGARPDGAGPGPGLGRRRHRLRGSRHPRPAHLQRLLHGGARRARRRAGGDGRARCGALARGSGRHLGVLAGRCGGRGRRRARCRLRTRARRPRRRGGWGARRHRRGPARRAGRPGHDGPDRPRAVGVRCRRSRAWSYGARSTRPAGRSTTTSSTTASRRSTRRAGRSPRPERPSGTAVPPRIPPWGDGGARRCSYRRRPPRPPWPFPVRVRSAGLLREEARCPPTGRRSPGS